MRAFRDARVAHLGQLGRQEAHAILSREALRRGALTSSELASRSGPTRTARVTIVSRLWAEPLATVYFAAEHAARAWANDLVSRLPDLDRPVARGPLWRLEVTVANVIRSCPSAPLSPWRAADGIVLEILEPHPSVADGLTRSTTAHGSDRGSSLVSVAPTGRASC